MIRLEVICLLPTPVVPLNQGDEQVEDQRDVIGFVLQEGSVDFLHELVLLGEFLVGEQDVRLVAGAEIHSVLGVEIPYTALEKLENGFHDKAH